MLASRTAAAALAAAGVAILAGGLLHPHVAGDPAEQARTVAAHAPWSHVHLALTYGQAVAAVLFVFVAADRSGRVPSRARAGLAVAAAGLVLAALATLGAATAVKTAASSGDARLFAAVAELDLAVGWLGATLSATGVAVAGTEAARRGRGWPRALGAVAAGGGALFVAAAVFVPVTHPWTHAYLLRWGAVGLGLLFVLVAAEAARAPRAAQ